MSRKIGTNKIELSISWEDVNENIGEVILKVNDEDIMVDEIFSASEFKEFVDELREFANKKLGLGISEDMMEDYILYEHVQEEECVKEEDQEGGE